MHSPSFTFKQLFTLLIIAFVALFAATILQAWTGPTATPPNNNVSAPINVGTIDQVKNGGIGMNSLAVFGNSLLDGTNGDGNGDGVNSYLNFGATSGSSGYGIRDNSGTLEFKSTGGSWNNLTNTLLNILGLGVVTQIKFSDGTTQTTAAGSSATSGGYYVTCQDGSQGGAYCDANRCNMVNPVTGSCSCPKGYVPYPYANWSAAYLGYWAYMCGPSGLNK